MLVQAILNISRGMSITEYWLFWAGFLLRLHNLSEVFENVHFSVEVFCQIFPSTPLDFDVGVPQCCVRCCYCSGGAPSHTQTHSLPRFLSFSFLSPQAFSSLSRLTCGRSTVLCDNMRSGSFSKTNRLGSRLLEPAEQLHSE